MKEYNKLKSEIKFLEQYRKDKTIQEIILGLNQQLVYLEKTVNVEGDFEGEFKIINASFNNNDESLLDLKVSFGDWIYEGIIELNKKGKEEILEAMKKHFSIFNKMEVKK